MKVFTIETETNNITIHASVKEADAVPNSQRFGTEAGLAKLAADWPMARLVEIFNSLPGETAVKKFKDRATAVSRIWRAIQTLGGSVPAEASQLETEPPAEIVAEPVAVEPAATTEEAEQVIPESGEPAVAAPVAPQTPDAAPAEAPAKNKATRAKSKTSQVIEMLKRHGGTTLDEIMTAMGWQKHTTRAMLSAGGSLTKNHGLVVTSEKVGNQRRYSTKA